MPGLVRLSDIGVPTLILGSTRSLQLRPLRLLIAAAWRGDRRSIAAMARKSEEKLSEILLPPLASVNWKTFITGCPSARTKMTNSVHLERRVRPHMMFDDFFGAAYAQDLAFALLEAAL